MNKDRTIQIIGHIVMFIITVCILLPLFILIGSSLTDNLTLIQCGYNVFPRKFSLDAYEYIFNSKESIFPLLWDIHCSGDGGNHGFSLSFPAVGIRHF